MNNSLLFREKKWCIYSLYIYIYIYIQNKNSTQPNLSVYVCETPSWKFKLSTLAPPHPTNTYTCGFIDCVKVC